MYEYEKPQKSKIILFVYLIAALALLFLGYSVQKPKVAWQEFPFTITYSYQGENKTIFDVYVGEYAPRAKYHGDNSVSGCAFGHTSIVGGHPQ